MNVRFQASLHSQTKNVTDRFGNPDVAYHGVVYDTRGDEVKILDQDADRVAEQLTTFERPRDALLATKVGTLNMNLAAANGDPVKSEAAQRAYRRFLARMYS